MTIEVIRRPISRARLSSLAEAQFGDMVKAVVDVDRGVMAIGGELHSDEEAALIEDGSAQANRSPNVEDAVLQDRIRQVVRPWWRVRADMTGHAALATGRWSTLTRGLELFDLTAGDDRWRGHRRREILRAREEFCRLFFDTEWLPPAVRTLRA